MAIPTGYTEESFARFIKDEVLLYVADTMEWSVNVPVDPIAPVTETITLREDFKAGSSIAHFVENTVGNASNPSSFGVGKGEKLVFAGADTTEYTVVDITYGPIDYAYGIDTYRLRFRVFPYNLTTKLAGVTATGSFTPTQNLVTTDPVYSYIMDEALLTLGYTGISSISATNIRQFRAASKVEAWRAVVGNCVSMTSIDNQEGNRFDREQVFNAARIQLSIAEQEYSLFNSPQTSSGGITSTTGSSIVRGSW